MSKVAIYARFSSDNQREESIDAQVRAAEEFAKQKKWVVVKKYIDRAKTATTDKRQEFQRMMDDSAKGLFDVILVHKLDRFSRNKYDSAIYKRKLRKGGIKLCSVTEFLDDSPESVILESVLEGMAEYYSRNLSREVMKGMRENAYQCKHTGGCAPLGYDVDPVTKKYIINEKEAPAVRLIFQMYLEGFGYDQIVGKLQKRCYRSKLGRPIGKGSIHDILRNEKYSGVYVFNRSASKDWDGKRNNHSSKAEEAIIRVPGGVPAIIAPEEFARAKEKMQANQRRPGAYKAKEHYLLSGLIVCGECLKREGKAYSMMGNVKHSGRDKRKHVTYRCSNRENTKQCTNKELNREYVEEFVLEQLEKQIFSDKAIPQLVRQLNEYQNRKKQTNGKEIERLKGLVADLKKQMDNLINAIAKGVSEGVFAEKLQKLEEEKAQAEATLMELGSGETKQLITEEMLRKMLGTFREYVKAHNTLEVKKFISNYIKQVIVYKDHVVVVFVLSVGGKSEGLSIKTQIQRCKMMNSKSCA